MVAVLVAVAPLPLVFYGFGLVAVLVAVAPLPLVLYGFGLVAVLVAVALLAHYYFLSQNSLTRTLNQNGSRNRTLQNKKVSTNCEFCLPCSPNKKELPMKKILLVAVLFSPFSFAEYVSPLLYKDLECSDLVEEFKGHRDNASDKSMKAIRMSIDLLDGPSYGNSKAKLADLEKDAEVSDAHVVAIKKAAKKINCGDLVELASK